jgi:DNA-binding IclR family transcriptional regulator
VDCGLLERDRSRWAYRLAAPVLSLAHAMRTGSPVLALAGALMRSEAEKRKINVGLAVADRDERVYLESVRYSRRVSWRKVVAGQRVPMELTSLRSAWLAPADEPVRERMLAYFKARRGGEWEGLSREIAQAVASVRDAGYCWPSWQPHVVALSTPVVLDGHPVHVLNMNITGDETATAVVDRLHEPLLALAKQLRERVAAA